MLRVTVLAFEGMSVLHLAIPCAVFGETPDRLKLRVASPDPSPLRSTAGVGLLAEAGLTAVEDADLVVVPTWVDPRRAPDRRLTQALRAAYARGATVMGLCLGAYALAAAGLLDGRAATTHWAFADDFAARFPEVRLEAERLYVEEGRVWTSAGAAAGLDCCLAFARSRFGGEFANRIARALVVAPHRDGGQAQFVRRPTPERPQDERLARLVEDLRAHPEAPAGLDELAARAGMSRRSFTRAFQAAMGDSPVQWLIGERVRRAQELLEASLLSVDDVAIAAGFGSTPSLRAHFARLVGASPQRWRDRFGRGRGAAAEQGRARPSAVLRD